MELLSSVSGSSVLSLTCLFLLSLHGWPGASAQTKENFQLQQPQAEVSVSLGQTLTLHCAVSELPVVGPVKWLKNLGGREELIYEQKGSFPRVTRAVNESSTNFTIHISDIQVKDAGTYYCVKFKKGDGQDERYASGRGTKVFVRGEWSPRPCRDPPEQLPAGKQPHNLILIYIAVGVICAVLALLVVAILYLIRTKQSKGKSSPSVRLHEPEKSSGAATQESDPNNLTYADLNFEKEKKSIRRIIEMSQQSEYACIQTSQAPATDDTLTYADLDMVHLSKAPKRPAPRPEEAGSEYASVQIQRK
nr:PREDICTED: tyrosine-protein phosphatase non-receptor type substrate 1-like [Struthio camelus australis]